MPVKSFFIMRSFNVINWDCNKKKFVQYDIIPYLVSVYNETKKQPKSFNEFKDFVMAESQYRFWGRCEYEIILTDWPNKQHEEKWDIYKQIMMNLDIVTKTLMQEVL